MKVLRILSGVVFVLLITISMSNILGAGNGKCKGKGNGKGNGKGCNQCSGQIMEMPKEDLSSVEKNTILYMREEEKLAYDIYTTLNKNWDMKVFSNITTAENRHFNLMGELIEKYALEDPAKDMPEGKFKNADLQKAYDNFIERGKKSKQEALLVGAEIEDLDIFDLMKDFAKVDNLDLKFVLNNLAKGSRNHMRAFYQNLKTLDITYSPKYISKEEYDKIVNSEKERGRM